MQDGLKSANNIVYVNGGSQLKQAENAKNKAEKIAGLKPGTHQQNTNRR